MKRMLFALGFSILVFQFIFIVQAQQPGVSGRWIAALDSGTVAFEFKADGNRLSGSLSQNGAAPASLSIRVVDGTTITFAIQSGGRTITFSGKVNGNEIAFNREVVMPPGGNPGGPGIFGRDGPKEFIAKRQAASEAAILDGIVIRARSGDPVPNATVELRSSAQGRGYPNLGIAPTVNGPLIAATSTDRDGKFSFAQPPGGTYRLVVAKHGYVQTSDLVNFRGAEHQTTNPIVLVPGGGISGRVSDRGQPAANVSVTAFKASYNDGQRVLTEVLTSYTNDLGVYNIYWLTPGLYYVAASVGIQPSQVGVNPDAASDREAHYAQVISPSASARPVLHLPEVSRTDESYVVTYHPNSPDWQSAKLIEVTSGSDVAGVNVDSSPLPVRHVRGRITGIPAGPNGVVLMPSLKLIHIHLGSVITASPDASGAFDIPVVIQGSYVLLATIGQQGEPQGARGQRGAAGRGGIDVNTISNLASRGMPADQIATLLANAGLAPNGTAPLEAHREIEVRNSDLDNIDLTLAPFLHLTGKIELESRLTAGASGLVGLRLILRPDPRIMGLTDRVVDSVTDSPQSSPTQFVATDARDVYVHASFTDLAIPAGNYRVIVDPIQSAPPSPLPAVLQNAYSVLQNAYVKSIRIGEVDVLKDGLRLSAQPKDPLVVVIGTKAGSLQGRVLDSKQRPVGNAAVVAMPNDNLRFRVTQKFAYTDMDGAYELPGLAPGEYTLFAWNDVEKFSWQDPDFLRKYEDFGRPVHIEEGQRQNANLAIAPGR